MLEEFKVAVIDSVLHNMPVRTFCLLKKSDVQEFYRIINKKSELRENTKNIQLRAVKSYALRNIRNIDNTQLEKDNWFFIACPEETNYMNSFCVISDVADGRCILKPFCLISKEPYIGDMFVLTIETVPSCYV